MKHFNTATTVNLHYPRNGTNLTFPITWGSESCAMNVIYE